MDTQAIQQQRQEARITKVTGKRDKISHCKAEASPCIHVTEISSPLKGVSTVKSQLSLREQQSSPLQILSRLF